MADITEIIPKKAITSITTTDTAITKLDESTLKFITTVSALSEALKKGGISYKDINKAQKETVTTKTQLTKLEKEQLSAEKALQKQRDKGLAQIAKLEQKEKDLQAAINKEVKSEQDLINKTNALVAVRKRLDVSTKKGQTEHKKLTAEINRNTIALKQQDKAISRSQRNVGNYGSALKGVGMQLAGALGLTSAVYLAIGALKSMFTTITQFGKAQSTLAATLGKTTSQITKLTDDAIAYGKATKFTATEVSGLQNELAKLGFAMGEISLMTDAVLKLAEATGADLGEAAKVTGVALKAFGLSAINATDVAATLAIATTKSALSFGDFETALSTVGAVANAFGFKLEDTVALMGKLKDAGFDSSKASTALRNILLSLADSNGALAKKLGGSVKSLDELIPALVKLKKDGVSLNETLQITDKRSVAAFNTLLQGADSVTTLRDAITGANDALDDMVTTKTDNTVDAMARMGSAWDGVVLTFRESDGFFTSFFNKISGFLNSLTDEYTSFFDKYVSLWSLGLINLGADEIASRKKTMDELNKLNGKELTDWVYFNKDKTISDDKFQRDLYAKAVERLAAVTIAEEQAEVRKTDAIKAAQKERDDEAAKSAAKQLEITQITAALFATATENELTAISKKADALRKKGVDEVSIELWAAGEIQKIKDKELEAAKQQKDKQIEVAQQQADKELSIRLKKLTEETKLEQDFNDSIDAMQDTFMEGVDEQAQKELDATAKLIKDKQALEAEALQKKHDDEKELAEKINELKNQLLTEGINAAFSIYQSSLERESQTLQLDRENELAAAGENEEAKAKVNEKYDKLEAAVKTKQAKTEKLQALFSIGLSTAMAIAKSIATVPLPVGLPLVILNAALGAVQLAVAIAKPIPKFFKGTDSAPDGIISVGEKGGELIHKKTGEMLYAPEQTYMSGMQGAKIYTNQETERIFNGSGSDSLEIKELTKINKRVASALENQTHYHFKTDRIIKSKGNYRRTWLNTKLAR